MSDTPSLTAQLLEGREERKLYEDKKDMSDLGMEVIDNLSQAAGESYIHSLCTFLLWHLCYK